MYWTGSNPIAGLLARRLHTDGRQIRGRRRKVASGSSPDDNEPLSGGQWAGVWVIPGEDLVGRDQLVNRLGELVGRALAFAEAAAHLRRLRAARDAASCRALLGGRLDEAAERIESAATLGNRIREPDTGNVRMSQRLERERARAQADEPGAFAADAIGHWTGAPIHAHASVDQLLALGTRSRPMRGEGPCKRIRREVQSNVRTL